MKQLDNTGSPLSHFPLCGCGLRPSTAFGQQKSETVCIFVLHLPQSASDLPPGLPLPLPSALSLALPPTLPSALPHPLPPWTVNKVDNNASDSMSVPQGSRRRCNCHASNRERATRVSPCKFSIIIVTFGQAQQHSYKKSLCVSISLADRSANSIANMPSVGVPPFKISI